MLLVASAALLAGGIAFGASALQGHPVEALAFGPIAGSLGALLGAVGVALVHRQVRDFAMPRSDCRAIGLRLREMYDGVLSEPLPDNLAVLASRL